MGAILIRKINGGRIMNNLFYYIMLAITTTYCVYVTDSKVTKWLFVVSAACWWLLAIGEIIVKIM